MNRPLHFERTLLFCLISFVAPSCGPAGLTESTSSSDRVAKEQSALVGPAVTVESPTAKILLASIKKSSTHTISFWKHTNGAIQVEETLDVDHDLVAGNVTLSGTNITGMRLVDAYRLLAQDKASPELVGTLAKENAVLDNAVPTASSHGDSGESPRYGTAAGGSQVATLAGAVPLAKTSCQITSDGWDWNGDIAWFKNNYCGNDSVWCVANGNYSATWSTAWYTNQNSWFRATGFEGSFCDSATFYFDLLLHACNGGIVDYPNNIYLGPRQLNTQSWYTQGCTSRADWTAKVTGNWSGQDYQSRLGLAVHRQ